MSSLVVDNNSDDKTRVELSNISKEGYSEHELLMLSEKKLGEIFIKKFQMKDMTVKVSVIKKRHDFNFENTGFRGFQSFDCLTTTRFTSRFTSRWSFSICSSPCSRHGHSSALRPLCTAIGSITK